MAYCSNCGTRVDGAKFCPNCGHEQGTPVQSPNRNIVYTEKSVGLAVLLNFIIVGAGQMYVGKVGRGLGFLLLGIVFPVIMAPFWFLMGSATEASDASGFLLAMMLVLILMLAYIAFVIYDGYVLAKDYNEYLNQNGRPPW